MLNLIQFVLLSVLGSLLTIILASRGQDQKPWSFKSQLDALVSWFPRIQNHVKETGDDDVVQDIKQLAECHETAALLADLIHTDGAGEWPPRTNHDFTTWPAVLRPYRDIYAEMAPLLPTPDVSLDDEINRTRLSNFRSRFQTLLQDRVDLPQVEQLLLAAEAGRWDVFPRDTYNGFYACIAWCRHAYR